MWVGPWNGSVARMTFNSSAKEWSTYNRSLPLTDVELGDDDESGGG